MDWKQEVFIFQHFSFYEQVKFHAQVEHEKSFITSGADLLIGPLLMARLTGIFLCLVS